ncbi:MAG: phosphoribosyl-ATP diphosphatase [Phycisphaeraceae bacterium]|nr:phosphoribosyl-ATP diphosphatase [Phycisphaerae bacterium]MBX3391246.1 phosphoribosyl-ATP diphosphatase [Phycisphaeraceae bacterium]
MIIPSIDLMDGRAVQLEQGKTKVIDAGDPRPIARLFGRVGEIAVIDLDAAMGRGSNADIIRELLALARCRVGGGIRDVQAARAWLDAGASKVILGTRAVPEVLEQLPRERLIAAVDARDGRVVVEGWTKPTPDALLDRVRVLAPYVGGFLVTFVETEGMLCGLGADRARPVIEAAGGARVTVAGGVRTADEIGQIDRAGADAQVGMAIYKGLFSVADAVSACLNTDRPDGLWPTVVVDESGRALGLCYSNVQSLNTAVQEGRGVYWSRRRGLWRKGETSGATQELLRVDLDCDRDALLFTIRQHGPGFCHRGTNTCWGNSFGLARLAATLEARRAAAPDGSYTARLLSDPALLASKIVEEARELAGATETAQVIHEAADVVYFTLARLVSAGASLADVERELDRRSLRVTRRPGDAKPGIGTGGEPARPEGRP